MANGDIAASVGYPVVAGSADIRQGYDDINLTRDLIAQYRLTGTIPWQRVVGLEAQLNAIRNKPYIRRHGSGAANRNLGDGQTSRFGDVVMQTGRGTWVVQGDGNFQFSPPVTGMYTVHATAAYNRTAGAEQAGTVWFQFRQGMTPNVGSSGTVVRQAGHPIESTNSPTINDLMLLNANQLYGFTLFNDSDAAIDIVSSQSRIYYSAVFETPVGTVA